MGTGAPKLRTLCGIVQHRGESLGLFTAVKITELDRTLHRLNRFMGVEIREAAAPAASDDSVTYDSQDSIAAVAEGVKALGYDLSEEDGAKVYEAFRRVAEKKHFVGTRELDAIIATAAMQVPPTYKVLNYVINSGNIITATANILMEKDGVQARGVGIGDGPIDAAFQAIEQIIGHHYELDDFQIQTVTEGRDAMGSALVKLRSGGRVYSGNGISTDIIGASVRAFVSALNKIAYEES
jgi:2-isopropylmalate synthase